MMFTKLKHNMKKKLYIVFCVRLMRLIPKIIKTPIRGGSYIFASRAFFERRGVSYSKIKYIMDMSPYLDDATADLQIEPHYTYHTAWAARMLSKMDVDLHIDISSHRFFATLVSAFVPVDYYEYRPAKVYLSGLNSKQADIMCLPFSDESVLSISCMHVVEHIGLGRYGDPIDWYGDKKAFGELTRVLSKKGSLLFVVPMAEVYRIEFNGQRVYDYQTLKSWFDEYAVQVVEFSLIPDDAVCCGMIEHATQNDLVGQFYACGCFCLSKC